MISLIHAQHTTLEQVHHHARSMPEVALTGKDHGQPRRIGGGNHIAIALRGRADVRINRTLLDQVTGR